MTEVRCDFTSSNGRTVLDVLEALTAGLIRWVGGGGTSIVSSAGWGNEIGPAGAFLVRLYGAVKPYVDN